MRKYKGRIVYRGDLIKHEAGEIVLYAVTATTPTALVPLDLVLFYGSCENNVISLSDAVQAFLYQRPSKRKLGCWCHTSCGFRAGDAPVRRSWNSTLSQPVFISRSSCSAFMDFVSPSAATVVLVEIQRICVVASAGMESM